MFVHHLAFVPRGFSSPAFAPSASIVTWIDIDAVLRAKDP
jgi:hypothetical protein